MTQTVTGLFDRYEDASAAVSHLEAIGIPHPDISIVANNVERWHEDDRTSEAPADAGIGAGIGAIAGGGAGLLAGLGIMAIPGVGPVVAAGWLVATAVGAVAGAAAGGAAGGIVGALTSSGVSEGDAHVYAEGVRRGGSLVTARVADDRVAEASAILERSHSVNVAERGSVYRKAGWSRFDADAPVYTEDQVRQARVSSSRI
jgi:hypothetical protein